MVEQQTDRSSDCLQWGAKLLPSRGPAGPAGKSFPCPLISLALYLSLELPVDQSQPGVSMQGNLATAGSRGQKAEPGRAENGHFTIILIAQNVNLRNTWMLFLTKDRWELSAAILFLWVSLLQHLKVLFWGFSQFLFHWICARIWCSP